MSHPAKRKCKTGLSENINPRNNPGQGICLDQASVRFEMFLATASPAVQPLGSDGIWQSITVGVVTGIFSSIIASLIFLFFLGFFLRPKISISDYVSAYTDAQRAISYQIKIVNNGLLFGVHDLSINMYKVYSVDGRGNAKGTNVTCDPIKLRTVSLPNLPRVSKDPKALYALRISIDDSNFEPKLHTDTFGNFFLIEVSGRHSLSGIKGHFTKELHNWRDFLKSGEFQHGKSLDVVE